MPRLEVLVGHDRFNLEPANVNQCQRPNEIDGPNWCGRVLVRILDADGAKEGEPGREYFKDRSRRFCIQLEGRFKKPWNGNEVLFGTDFDKFVDFPRAPFNAGMRVAKMIDPATFFEMHPPSDRPYIMSPMMACMNTLCAWPSPARAHEAVVVLRHTTQDGTPSPGISRTGTPAHFDPATGPAKAAGIAGQHLDDLDDDSGDIVPIEALSPRLPEDAEAAKSRKRKSWFSFGGAPKEQRHTKKYWRFVGFRDEPRVRAFVEAHHASLKDSAPPTSASTPAAAAPVEPSLDRSNSAVSTDSTGSVAKAADVQQGHAATPTLQRLGTFSRKAGQAIANALQHDDEPGTPQLNADAPLSADVDALTDAAEQQLALKHGKSSSATEKEEAKPGFPKLQRIDTELRLEVESAAQHDGIKPEDFGLAGDHLARARSRASKSGKGGVEREASSSSAAGKEEPFESKLDEQLGPWRFADPAVDMVEDNAFVFTHSSYPVARRRKHFASAAHREEFQFDPDIVYGSSFYTDAFDFTSFQVGLGPVSINIQRFFKEMPLRYTLRGPDELSFVTISFQLVDD